MESEFDGRHSIVLSESDNQHCDITLACETPKPLLSSTAQKRNINNNSSRFNLSQAANNNNQNSRGSYIPRPRPKVSLPSSRVIPPSNGRSSTGSSISLKSENSSFKDDSSLSILDLNDMPDARSSASLVHVNSKTSSIGSWLDNCFSNDEQSLQPKSKPNDESQQERASYFLPLRRAEAFDLQETLMDTDMLRPPSQASSNKDDQPVMQAMPRSPFGSDESINSEFEFDEAELDLEGLINEDEEELDQTMKASRDLQEPQQETEQVETTEPEMEADVRPSNESANVSGETAEPHTTTMDFLRGLGFLAKPQLQTQEDTGMGSPLNASKIDSKYFAQMSMQSVDDDSRTFNASDAAALASPQIQPLPEPRNVNQNTEETAEDVFDGKVASFAPVRTSTVDTDGFGNWPHDNPLDFSATEFQSDSKLQKDLFGDEHFASGGNVNDILDKEEEAFMKEHQFSLDENFQAQNESNNLHDFSTYRTSMMTVPDDDAGKVSIGTYMAERSAKLGDWDGTKRDERPSFGLKVRTPSPQKPCALLSGSTPPINETTSSAAAPELTPYKPASAASTSIDISHFAALAMDDTVDKSMMDSLSKAISNMSASMNNEDLAKFIVALSNQKLESQKQLAKSKDTFVVPSTTSSRPASHESSVSENRQSMDEPKSTTSSHSDHPKSHQQEHDVSTFVAEQMNATNLTNKSESSTLIVEKSQRLSSASSHSSSASTDSKRSSTQSGEVGQQDKEAANQSSKPSTPQDSLEKLKTPSNVRSYETDELPSLPQHETIFSPDSVNSHFLSSTRANLSLTRGSLSRESIENLHRKLRVRLDQKEVGSSVSLPDLVTNKTTQTNPQVDNNSQQTDPLSKEEEEYMKNWKGFKSDHQDPDVSSRPSIGPLSHSSPDKSQFTKVDKFDETNMSRLSSAFHQLLPSTSFNEMATVAECDFDERHLPHRELPGAGGHLDTIREEEEPEKRASLESKHEISSCSSVEPVPKASSTKFDADLSQASRASSDRLSGISAVPSHPPVHQHSSQYMIRPPMDASGHPDHPMYPPYFSAATVMPPHPASYLPGQPATDLYHRMHPNLSMPPMPVQASMTSYGPSYMMDRRSFDSTVYSTRSHPSHNYPTILPHPAHHATSVMSCPQDRRVYPMEHELYDAAGTYQITTPNELVFEKLLCVGVPGKTDLPLKNTSSRWIQAEVRPVSVTINRQPVSTAPESHVTVKRKYVIGPHSTEHADVTLMGHAPGRHDVIVEVTSHMIAMEGTNQMDQRCHVTTLNLRANVEAPEVALFGTPEMPRDRRSRAIDFGEVVYGAVKSLPLRILNQSKVEFPVRVVVYSSAPDRAFFTLSLTSSRAHRYEDGPAGGMYVLRRLLPVSTQPTTVWLHLHSNSRHSAQAEKPEPVEARIEVVLDATFKPQDGSSGSSSQVQSALDSILAKGLLGIGKLHAPRSQQAMSFSAVKDSKESSSFPVKNAGNITVQVEFLVQSHCDHFAVTPITAVLPPGGEVELTVNFAPPTDTPLVPGGKAVNTLVLMNILPSGPQFEVKVSGSLVAKQPRLAGSSRAPTSLLTNKTRLRWGGTSIGDSTRQKLMLRSGPCDNPFALRVSIKGDSSNSYQIVTSESGCEELSSRCDMTITPGEDKPIHVQFAPSRRKLVHAKLEVKTPVDDLPATKYTIPLSGYGGKGEVTVEDQDPSDKKGVILYNGYQSRVFVMRPKIEGGESFVVKNIGCRASYVKAMVYSDATCKHIASEVTCRPAQFVLQERQDRRIALRSSGATQSCFVCIWNGDELARQQLKLALRARSSASSLVNKYVPDEFAHLRSVAFDGVFEGEDPGAEEDLSNYEPHAFDVQLFYGNLRQAALEVVAKQPQPDLLSLAGSDQSKIAAVAEQQRGEAERDVEYLLSKLSAKSQAPNKPTPAAEVTKDSHTPFALNWDVSPAYLTLDTPTAKGIPQASRVKLINRSSASLHFDVVWPGHYLTITPNQGRVEPESASVLLISANPSLVGRKEILPWCGQAMVVATGSSQGGTDNTRIIHLQIKSHENPESDSVSSSSSKTSGVSCDVAAASPPVANQPPLLRLSSHVIDFGDVTAGANGKSHLEFRNMSKSDTKWVLTSFAPAYVKDADSSGDVFRSTYAAFVFSHTSGRLEPGARIQVPVTFNPMNPGLYTQHWEIEYHEVRDTPALTLQRAKISLQGQCIKTATVRRPVVSSATGTRKANKSEIYISEDCYTFERTSVGKSSILKIPIKNKGKSAHTVKFVNIRPPFHTAHLKHTVRSMHCANLPVTFKPISPGSYTGTLIVQTESEEAIHVTLKAVAV